MKLEHSFTVPTGIDDAWRILLDIDVIGPCMPGAAIDSIDGDDFTGTVKVKLGPIGLTYKGKASFIEKDEVAHRAVIDARGRDARGNGTAAAKVTAVLRDQGGSTLVTVETDLDITGKPAQFGRGVMVDVGNKLIGQFADNLAATITSNDQGAPPAPAAAPAKKRAARPTPLQAESSGSAAEAPVVEAPATKTPSTTTAASKTPAAKTPATKTPAAKTPAAKTPATKTPATRSAVTETPAAEAPLPGAAGEPEPPTAAEAVATAGPIERAAVEAVAAAPGYSAPADTRSDAGSEPVDSSSTGVNGHQQPRRPVTPPRDVEPINLLESAGPAVAKRLAPVAAVLVVLLIVLRRRAKH